MIAPLAHLGRAAMIARAVRDSLAVLPWLGDNLYVTDQHVQRLALRVEGCEAFAARALGALVVLAQRRAARAPSNPCECSDPMWTECPGVGLESATFRCAPPRLCVACYRHHPDDAAALFFRGGVTWDDLAQLLEALGGSSCTKL